MSTKYDSIGVRYDASRRADPYLLHRILALLAPISGGAYLDAACGSGNYTVALSESGVNMTGLDVSSTMIDSARQKSSAVNWIMGDASAVPFKDGTFDGAVCTLAIHHFENLDSAFSEIWRVLRGGRLVILTATRQQMRGYWLNAYFPEAMAKSIEQMPDEPDVERSLVEAGFKGIRTEPYDVRPDLRDMFLYSGKHRPEIYLDERIRSGISTFSHLMNPEEMKVGCERLRSDIASGRIQSVMESYDRPGGDYLFMTADA